MSDQVQEIYERLLGQTGTLTTIFFDVQDQKRHGKEVVGCCPFCGKPGHFSYSLEKPVWRCWVCDNAGDWIKYVMTRRSLTFPDALQYLADLAGIQLQGPADAVHYQQTTTRANLLEAAGRLFVADLEQPAGAPVLQYLQQRGYTLDEIRGMGLGAYTDRDGVKRALQQQGYSLDEIKASGLLTIGLGDTHTLTMVWRDPAGRAAGLTTRCLLPADELQQRGLQKYKHSFGTQINRSLAGLTSIRGSKQVAMVEGPLDALSLNYHGSPAVGLGGKSLHDDQLQALKRAGVEEIYLCLDRDQAGRDAMARAIDKLRDSSLRAYAVTLPAGAKDPDELVRASGIEAWTACLHQAESWPAWRAKYILSRHDLQAVTGLDRALDEAFRYEAGIDDVLHRKSFRQALLEVTGLTEEDVFQRETRYIDQRAAQQAASSAKVTMATLQGKLDEQDFLGFQSALESGLQALRSNRAISVPDPYLLDELTADAGGYTEGLKTGYTGLDRQVRIPEGALTIVAGRPGHGKTTLMLNLLKHMLGIYPDKRFYFFSYEESKFRLSIKLILSMAGVKLAGDQVKQTGAYINYLQEKRGTNHQVELALQDYEQLTSSGRLVIVDTHYPAENLANVLAHLAERGDIGAVFIDYIQKIPVQKSQSQRYLEVKRASELLLEQAVQHNLPLILGAQLGRPQPGSSGADRAVRLENLRESGDIEQDANLVIGLYNESVDKTEQGDTDNSQEVDIKLSILKNRDGMSGQHHYLRFKRSVLQLFEERE